MLRVLLAHIVLLHIFAGVVTALDISKTDLDVAKTKLTKIFGSKANIPDELHKWLAILDKNMDLVRCLPTLKSGNCYRSRQCTVPKLKLLGKELGAVLWICKDPWKIMLDLVLPRMPWWIKVNVDRIVIPIEHLPAAGVTKIHSVSNGKARFLGIIGTHKVSLIIDALLRWDCQKPTNNKVTRNEYNLKAPDKKYNALFYTFKIRLEFKQKNFWCWCYKCKRCEDLVNQNGVFGYGPSSCQAETAQYLADKNKPKPVQSRRRRRRRRRRWWGKK